MPELRYPLAALSILLLSAFKPQTCWAGLCNHVQTYKNRYKCRDQCLCDLCTTAIV